MPTRPSVGSGQDWGSVNVGKASIGGASGAASKGSGATEKRYGAGTNSSTMTASGMSARKLEESEETKHAKVDKSLSKAIMQARTGKKWTQKQLATAINEKPQIIGEYESGKAIPNGALIAKMERALGCKLPRPSKKKPATASSSATGAKKPTGSKYKGQTVTRGGPPARR